MTTKLNLGCGKDYRPGWVNCDKCLDVRADVHFDLTVFPWPLEKESADDVLLNQVLEHLPDTVRTMEEVHRVLKPGGHVRIYVPYCKCDCAFQDPTHVRFFTERSFDYFTESNPYNFYSPVRFKIASVYFTSMNLSLRLCLRNLIPFRFILRWWLWNMYDGLSFDLVKI